MKKSLVLRVAASSTALAAAAAALASEGAPDMQMEGSRSILVIVGGLAGMGVVIWLGLKLLNRKK